MKNIPASKSQTSKHKCKGCGRRIYDDGLSYCSIRCRISCESFKTSETGPKVRKELEVLMAQYARGGIGEEYYS